MRCYVEQLVQHSKAERGDIKIINLTQHGEIENKIAEDVRLDKWHDTGKCESDVEGVLPRAPDFGDYITTCPISTVFDERSSFERSQTRFEEDMGCFVTEGYLANRKVVYYQFHDWQDERAVKEGSEHMLMRSLIGMSSMSGKTKECGRDVRLICW